MCGIISIITRNDNFMDIMFDGLRQLQNRGYDSAGICSIYNNKFILNKYASEDNTTALDKLEYHIVEHIDSSIGIGHTRWATHGPKTDENSHPHISSDNKFAIVHNGIIENYKYLKDYLIKEGYTFKSQTDTEVIANLLAFTYKKHIDVIESINETIQLLEGTWGLSILCIDTPTKIYCTRHGSPLLISNNDDYVIVSSEQSGFSKFTNRFFVLKNYDICIIDKTDDKLTIKTNEHYELKNTTIAVENSIGNYPHWTIKEIYEQIDSINNVISYGGRLRSLTEVKLGGLETHKTELLKIDNLILLGCGTSYYASMLGLHYFKDLCNFNCVLSFDGAEFTEKDIPLYGTTGLILLSQSGETKDLYRCIQIAKEKGLFTIGVVNVVDSLIAREVNCGCYLNAGREVAVASTKSFTSQCILLSMIAIWFSQNKNIHNGKRLLYIKDLYNLQKDVIDVFDGIEEKITKHIDMFNNSSCFLLGKGKSEAIAKEGALKIKEITYIHSEGYSTSSLKHGPFALLTDDFPVIIIALNDEFYAKNENAYNEIKSRNAKVLFITDNISAIKEKENVILIPENRNYGEIFAVIILQLLAYKLSIARGINPDFPKNLAKVVTVE